MTMRNEDRPWKVEVWAVEGIKLIKSEVHFPTRKEARAFAVAQTQEGRKAKVADPRKGAHRVVAEGTGLTPGNQNARIAQARVEEIQKQTGESDAS